MSNLTNAFTELQKQARLRAASRLHDLRALGSMTALRSVTTAVLFCLSDQSALPATLVLQGQAFADRIELSVELQPHAPAQASAAPASPTGYRLLRWEDVELLAAAESVGLAHSGTSARLSFGLQAPA